MTRSIGTAAQGALCALFVLLAACGGGGDAASADGAAGDSTGDAAVALDPAVACADLRPVPVAMAVLDFITTAEPKPLRFLNASGSDSALPPAAEAVVQDKGPTFYWLPSEANQQQIREKLRQGGDWPNMLVLIRQNEDRGDGTHVIRVAGRYIGSSHEGTESPEKRYTIRCQVDSAPAWEIAEISGGGA